MSNSKNIDYEFDLDEFLYRRFCPKDLSDGKFAPASVKPPDWSVNRSKYSKPEDVLHKDIDCCGIAYFKFKDVNQKKYEPSETQSPHMFQFFIEHDPTDDNYSHSLVTVYRDNQKFTKNLPATLKKKFRFFLSSKIEIIRYPKTNSCKNL